jgi:hypothetical protein
MAFVEQPTVGISATGQVTAFLQPSVVAVSVDSLTYHQNLDVQEKCNHIAAEIVFATIQLFNIAQLQSPSQHSVHLENTTHGFAREKEGLTINSIDSEWGEFSLIQNLAESLIELKLEEDKLIGASFVLDTDNAEFIKCIIARTAIFINGQPCVQQTEIVAESEKTLEKILNYLAYYTKNILSHQESRDPQRQAPYRYMDNGSNTPVDMQGGMVAASASESASSDLGALTHWWQMR